MAAGRPVCWGRNLTKCLLLPSSKVHSQAGSFPFVEQAAHAGASILWRTDDLSRHGFSADLLISLHCSEDPPVPGIPAPDSPALPSAPLLPSAAHRLQEGLGSRAVLWAQWIKRWALSDFVLGSRTLVQGQSQIPTWRLLACSN